VIKYYQLQRYKEFLKLPNNLGIFSLKIYREKLSILHLNSAKILWIKGMEWARAASGTSFGSLRSKLKNYLGAASGTCLRSLRSKS